MLIFLLKALPSLPVAVTGRFLALLAFAPPAEVDLFLEPPPADPDLLRPPLFIVKGSGYSLAIIPIFSTSMLNASYSGAKLTLFCCSAILKAAYTLSNSSS